MGRCDDGPVVVVYPEAIWYQVFDRADIDEIIEKHLIGQVPVDRLRI
jgi:(2Fe-2S) ferredoxin